jgi:hypothetical protein
MANPERGEVPLIVGDRTYTLKLSMNAAAALEGRLKKSLGDIMRDAGSLNFQAIRTLVWLLLQKYHAAEFKTEAAAGELIDEAGGIGPFFAAIQQLQTVNQPDEQKEPSGDPENPPDAQGGTGDVSS